MRGRSGGKLGMGRMRGRGCCMRAISRTQGVAVGRHTHSPTPTCVPSLFLQKLYKKARAKGNKMEKEGGCALVCECAHAWLVRGGQRTAK